MTPQLSLQYSSNGGPSPWGHGWELPLGRIERSTKHGLPRCPNANDFVLSLPGTTVELVNDPPGSTTYRPLIEEKYILAEKNEAANSWIVHDRSGMKFTFGDADAARVVSNRSSSDPHVFMQSAADGYCNYTAAWALVAIEDPNGNDIEISYFSFENVVYPTTILYGGNARSHKGTSTA